MESSGRTMKKVLIVGAGSAGIAAGKACREGGIDFVCYEKSGRAAGLWNYHEDDLDGEASVMKTTVINSSKEMSSFSDFPPPKEFPNYMHNRMMLKYFISYAEKFGVLENVKYYHEVQKLVPAPDYDETGRWIATIRNTRDQTVLKETFDGVMICTGHHGYPHVPRFRGQEDFKGKITHSHSVRVPDAYKDQRVLIIGAGNSALDAAVDLSSNSSQVYLSTRRGAWIMFRLGRKGLPNDIQLLTRAWNWTGRIFSRYCEDAFLERVANDKFDHATYNIKPKHRFSGQHLAINDHIPNKILSGTIILKGDVKTFTEKGIIFEGEDTVTKVDSVILGTGYKIKFPFLSQNIVDTTENRADLYKLMFPPSLKHSSLAVIGLIQPFGSLFPVFEAQSRWFVQLLHKKVPSLPPCDVMTKDIYRTRKAMLKRYVATPRHTIQIDYIQYMDDIYSQIGAKPDLVKMAFNDPALFLKCFFGPCVSYQYRLQGPHSWPGARQAIMDAGDRVMHPLNSRKGAEKNSFFHSMEFIFCLIFLAIGIFVHLIYSTITWD